MYTQVLTVSVAELEKEERALVSRILYEECAATCDVLTGMVAQQWSINEQTNIISGIVKWADDAAMRRGTEALSMVVATVHPDRIIPTHRAFAYPVQPRFLKEARTRKWTDDRPNSGFVQFPPDYDPRG